jgi:hypothetical protein
MTIKVKNVKKPKRISRYGDIDYGSTLALSGIDTAIEKHLVSRGFTWEWRSVLGKDCNGNPIWNLNIYVEKESK